MNKILCIGTLGLAWMWMGFPASAGASESVVWQGEARIEFDATSTLHDFTGTAQANPFPVQIQWDGTAATLGGTAMVAIAEMDTQHAKRDRNMRKMFDADAFPILTGVVRPVRIDPACLNPVPLELTILGQTRSVPASVTAWQVQDGILRLNLNLMLSLREWGLKPPVILGFIRVGDAVAVRVYCTLHPPSPE